MRANEVKVFLSRLYKAETEAKVVRSSVLLLGGPGIGKSTAVREWAEEEAKQMGKEFVDYSDEQADRLLEQPDKYFVFHNLPLVGCEPSDLTGHPRLTDGRVRYYPLEWARVMSRCAGALFLDDFLDTQRLDVMSAAYRITLERRIGYIYLHPDVQVVAASNTPEYSTLSSRMPCPLANRLVVIRQDPPTVREWAEWMNARFGNGWDRKVYAFLERFRDAGYIFQPVKEAETLEEMPTPRSWSKLAVLLAQGINSEEVIDSVIGAEMGQKFAAFSKIDVDLNELARNPEQWKKLNLDAKYIASIMLATEITARSAQKWVPLIAEMGKDSREWLIVLSLAMPHKKRSEFYLAALKAGGEVEQIFKEIEEVAKRL
jgi:hypothetical protein